jgi:hypothetical protein
LIEKDETLELEKSSKSPQVAPSWGQISNKVLDKIRSETTVLEIK